MLRILSRTLAVALVLCLTVDPTLAAALSQQQSIAGRHPLLSIPNADPFQEQALELRLMAPLQASPRAWVMRCAIAAGGLLLAAPRLLGHFTSPEPHQLAVHSPYHFAYWLVAGIASVLGSAVVAMFAGNSRTEPVKIPTPEENATVLDHIIQEAARQTRIHTGMTVEPFVYGDVKYLTRLIPYSTDLDLALIYDDGDPELDASFGTALQQSVRNEFINALSGAAQQIPGWSISPSGPEETSLTFPKADGTAARVVIELSPIPHSRVNEWGFFEPQWHLGRFLTPNNQRQEVAGLLAASYYLSESQTEHQRLVEDFLVTDAQPHPDWAAFLRRWSNLAATLHERLKNDPAGAKRLLTQALRRPLRSVASDPGRLLHAAYDAFAAADLLAAEDLFTRAMQSVEHQPEAESLPRYRSAAAYLRWVQGLQQTVTTLNSSEELKKYFLPFSGELTVNRRVVADNKLRLLFVHIADPEGEQTEDALLLFRALASGAYKLVGKADLWMEQSDAAQASRTAVYERDHGYMERSIAWLVITGVLSRWESGFSLSDSAIDMYERLKANPLLNVRKYAGRYIVTRMKIPPGELAETADSQEPPKPRFGNGGHKVDELIIKAQKALMERNDTAGAKSLIEQAMILFRDFVEDSGSDPFEEMDRIDQYAVALDVLGRLLDRTRDPNLLILLTILQNPENSADHRRLRQELLNAQGQGILASDAELMLLDPATHIYRQIERREIPASSAEDWERLQQEIRERYPKQTSIVSMPTAAMPSSDAYVPKTPEAERLWAWSRRYALDHPGKTSPYSLRELQQKYAPSLSVGHVSRVLQKAGVPRKAKGNRQGIMREDVREFDALAKKWGSKHPGKPAPAPLETWGPLTVSPSTKSRIRRRWGIPAQNQKGRPSSQQFLAPEDHQRLQRREAAQRLREEKRSKKDLPRTGPGSLFGTKWWQALVMAPLVEELIRFLVQRGTWLLPHFLGVGMYAAVTLLYIGFHYLKYEGTVRRNYAKAEISGRPSEWAVMRKTMLAAVLASGLGSLFLYGGALSGRESLVIAIGMHFVLNVFFLTQAAVTRTTSGRRNHWAYMPASVFDDSRDDQKETLPAAASVDESTIRELTTIIPYVDKGGKIRFGDYLKGDPEMTRTNVLTLFRTLASKGFLREMRFGKAVNFIVTPKFKAWVESFPGIGRAATTTDRPRKTSVVQTPWKRFYPGRSLTLADLGHHTDRKDIAPGVFETMFLLADGGRMIRGLESSDLDQLEWYVQSIRGGFNGQILLRGQAMRNYQKGHQGTYVFRKVHPQDRTSHVYEVLAQDDVLMLVDTLVNWKEGKVQVGDEQIFQHQAIVPLVLSTLRKALPWTASAHAVADFEPVELEIRHEGHDRLAENDPNGPDFVTLVVDGKLNNPVLGLGAMLSESMHRAWPRASEPEVEKRAHELLFQAVVPAAVQWAYAPLQKFSDIAGELAELAADLVRRGWKAETGQVALSAALDRALRRIPELPNQRMRDVHRTSGLVPRLRRLSPLPGNVPSSDLGRGAGAAAARIVTPQETAETGRLEQMLKREKALQRRLIKDGLFGEPIALGSSKVWPRFASSRNAQKVADVMLTSEHRLWPMLSWGEGILLDRRIGHLSGQIPISRPVRAPDYFAQGIRRILERNPWSLVGYNAAGEIIAFVIAALLAADSAAEVPSSSAGMTRVHLEHIHELRTTIGDLWFTGTTGAAAGAMLMASWQLARTLKGQESAGINILRGAA